MAGLVSVKDSIKLGAVLLAVGAVDGMSCDGITGCLSCRGKQSTSLLLLLSSSGRRADCLVPDLFIVRLRGACVGLCVMAGRENEYPCCSCSCWRTTRCRWMQSTSSGRSLLLLSLFLSVFGGSVDLSVVDSIKLGEVLLAVSAVGEMPCGCTGCLSCRGKQSTSSSSSSLGRSLLFSILS